MLQFQGFKPQAMDKIASSLGYTGDMSRFEEFLYSNPEAYNKFNMYKTKAINMMNGGMIRKNYQEGGTVMDSDGVLGDEGTTPEETEEEPDTIGVLGPSGIGEVALNRLKTPGAPVGGKLTASGTTYQTTQDIGTTAGKVSSVNPTAQGTTSTAAESAAYDPRFTDLPIIMGQLPDDPRGFYSDLQPSPVLRDDAQVTGQQQAAAPQGYSILPTKGMAEADTTKSIGDIRTELQGTGPAQGVLSDGSLAPIQQGQLSEGATPEAPKFDPSLAERVNPNRQREVSEREQVEFAKVGIVPKSSAPTASDVDSIEAAKFTGDTPQITTQDQYNLTPTQSATQAATQVQDAAKATQIPTAEAANSTWQSIVSGAQGTVGANEIVNAGDIVGATEAVTSIAATIDTLNEQAITSAAQGSFSQTALATAQQGTVNPAETVQGQMSKLMEQFKTGTPFWASGAMRAANAAMASRGMGASSMASAAIVQATMEAALPIASQDAQFYQAIGMANLDNRQKVSLANAAAQQNITLQNLNNRQQAALQDSTNAFALQTQNLSNQQSVVLSNAQIKSSLQNKVLDINTQASIINAAKYAEQNKINLSNEQQSLLQRSSENLQINMSNLTNDQQTALSNLQVRAALTGQELDNAQQTAMLTSTQSFSAAQFDATSKQQAFVQDAQARAALEGNAMDIRQQTQVFNASKLLEERNIELTNEQQTKLFNSTNKLNVDMADLSNRQQSALANAQIEASLRGQELNNQQQAAVVNAERFAEANNLTFTTQQQTELYNSQLMQGIGNANLNAAQATTLQNAAQLASMDMANLNARQQTAVQNAQSFLQMDMANLSNEQQSIMFATQTLAQSLFTDAAASNATSQFNASSENQADQFFGNLKTQNNQFNATQKNAMAQFNNGESNAISKFNTEIKNQREQFNAQNDLVINQSNAVWRREIATASTAAINRANEINAMNILDISNQAYANLWQEHSDMMGWAWESADNERDRQNDVTLSHLAAGQDRSAAEYQTDVAASSSIGDFVSKLALGYASKVLGF